MMFIEPPRNLAQVLDALHDQQGTPDVESVQGGTQVNLKGCAYKAVLRAIQSFPEHERISGVWTTRIGKYGYHAPHVHPEGKTSGVYYVRTVRGGNLKLGAATLIPSDGLFVTFDSKVLHSTTPCEEEGRLTIAFDMQ